MTPPLSPWLRCSTSPVPTSWSPTRARSGTRSGCSPALTFADTAEEAADGADIVLLLTEWREYVELDPVLLAKRVHTPRIFDCRNALNAAAWAEAGWDYRCLGRPLAGG